MFGIIYLDVSSRDTWVVTKLLHIYWIYEWFVMFGNRQVSK